MRHLPKKRRIGNFRAEDQRVGKIPQNIHRRTGKIGGTPRGPGERKLQYKVGTAPHRRFRPEVFIRHGKAATLDGISTHHADNALRPPLFRLVKQEFMPRVQRIEFANDPKVSHFCPFSL